MESWDNQQGCACGALKAGMNWATRARGGGATSKPARPTGNQRSVANRLYFPGCSRKLAHSYG